MRVLYFSFSGKLRLLGEDLESTEYMDDRGDDTLQLSIVKGIKGELAWVSVPRERRCRRSHRDATTRAFVCCGVRAFLPLHARGYFFLLVGGGEHALEKATLHSIYTPGLRTLLQRYFVSETTW